jgi:DNA-binding NarL/FixJ family response regulator
MAAFWEQTGVLGPIYRLVGKGLNDEGIALKLGLTEVKVRGWIGWIVHFLELNSRQELVLYASTAA